MMIAGTLGGMASGGLVAWLRIRFNANEILTSLMLTYVAQYLLVYLVTGPWRDPQGFGFPQTALFSDAAPAPRLIADSNVHLGILLAPLIAVALCGSCWKNRCSAFSSACSARPPRAARFAGFSENRLVWIAMLISGGLAGLAGMLEATGTLGQLTTIAVARLRLHRDHRRVPRPAEPARRDPGRAAAGADLSRRRRGADRSRPAQRGHRHLPGHPAVLSAGLRLPAAASASAGAPRAGEGRRDDRICSSPFLVSVIAAATPLLLAATGELVVERVGVLNLGVEGMMLAGAIAGFASSHETGITSLGVLAAIVAGTVLALLFAVLSLTLQANQTATGLALTIFGRGFSALVGAGYVGIPAPTLPKLHIPVLSDIPVLGPVLFHHDILVYASLVDPGRGRLGDPLHASRPDHARGRRFARRGACAGLSGGADPLRRGGVRRRAGGAGRRLYVARLYAAVGAGHDRRAAAGSRWRWSRSPPGGRSGC